VIGGFGKLRPVGKLRPIKEALHLVLEPPVTFFLNQHVPPIGKAHVLLVLGFELRVKTQKILVFRRKVSFSMQTCEP
jgi:hypothetical protein